MSTSVVSGEHFCFDGTTVSFFDQKGAWTRKGSWAVSVAGFGGIMVEVSPDAELLNSIQGYIDSDIAAGHDTDIAQLQVTPGCAVSLVLSRIITREHLRHVDEHDTYLDIPNVEVCGRNLVVRVDNSADYSIATADKDGNILWT